MPGFGDATYIRRVTTPSDFSARAPARPRPGIPGGDDALLARFVGGDERALGELYDRYGTAVHSLAARILQDEDEAGDVVEETFWQAWRQRSAYDASRGAVSTWLLTIGRSRALDRVRRRARRREEPLDVREPADSPRNPALDAELADLGERVRAQLAELPPEQREAIELAYFGGLTQTEIAARTGQPLGTVKTRVRLGLQKLRAGLRSLEEG